MDIRGPSASQDHKMLTKREKRFTSNEKMVLDDDFEMPLPSSQDYPMHIKEIFKYLESSLQSEDLVDLMRGETSKESLINIYFKILEKINLVLLKANDYLKAQSTAGAIGNIESLATQKVLYCNTNFIRELFNCTPPDYDALRRGPETD